MYKSYRTQGKKRFGPYYYTTVRTRDGRTKTIYLGKTREEALGNEAKMAKSNSKEKIPNLGGFTVPVLLALAMFSVVLLPGFSPTGLILDMQTSYLPNQSVQGRITFALEPEDFIPEDTRIVVSLAGRTKSLTLSELINKTGKTIESGTGNYHRSGTGLTGCGLGYGIKGQRTIYPNLTIEYNLTLFPLRTSTTPFSITPGTIITPINETANQTRNKTPTLHNATNETVIQSYLLNGSLNYENPYRYTIEADPVNYTVGIILVKKDDTLLPIEVLTIRSINQTIIIETNYSKIQEGFGPGFLSNRTEILSLSVQELGLKAPEEPGLYSLYAEMSHNSTVISNASILILVEQPQLPDSDGDGNPDLTDCAPSDPSIHHTAEEICNGLDDNCNGKTDKGFDQDRDGYTSCNGDCDDTNPGMNPGAKEICSNGIDEDCNGVHEQCKAPEITKEETLQYRAVIGKPVRWIKKVKLSAKAGNITVTLPENITNITGNKILNGIKREIRKATIKQPRKPEPPPASTRGFLTEESAEEGTELTIEEETEELEIEYYTPAPEAMEHEISPYRKQITVTSEVHYQDIIAYTSLLTEAPADSVHLYWLRNGSRTEVEADKYDIDNNTLVDYIEWIIPSLSSQSYELEITILNVQSYPMVGGNWTVAFNTTGTADLKITAVNGTKYSEAPDADLEFLQIKRGSNVVEDVILIDDKNRTMPYEAYILRRAIPGQSNSSSELQILISQYYNLTNVSLYEPFNIRTIRAKNFSSTLTNYHVVKVLTPGTHTQLFMFGGLSASARNFASANISFAAPTPDNDSNINVDYAYVNVTSQEDLNQSLLEWSNSSGLTNVTMDNSSATNWYKNMTSLSDGNYNCTVWAQNTTGTWVQTSRRFWTVDTVNPILTIDSPLNNTNFNNRTILFNISSSESSNAMILVDINSSLVSWWRFDDTNSTGDSTDYMGRNNGSKKGDAQQVSNGYLGKGFEFDGNGDYVDCGKDASLEMGTGNMTITAWIRTSQSSEGQIVRSDQIVPFYILGIDGSQLRATIANGTDIVEDQEDSGPIVNDGAWHHVAVVFNRSGNLTFYKDGVATEGKDISSVTGNVSAPSQYLAIGKRPNTETQYFNGTIDDVIIFNRSLSAEEILALYNATRLEHYENFSDGSYSFTAYTQDLAGNLDEKTQSFIVDTQHPGIAYNTSTETDNENLSRNNIFVNVTAWDSNNVSTFIDFDDSLVSWWRFDDLNSSGDGVRDYMNRNNGTPYGDAHQVSSGYFGKGFEFDGSGDYVDVGSEIDTSGILTICSWIKYTFNDDDRIVDNGKLQFFIRLTTRLKYSSDGGTTTYTTGTVISQNQWQHVCAERNSSGYVNFYVNGVSVGGGDTGTPEAGSTILIIGDRSAGDRPFNGTIDEVLIFNRSLTVEEILVLYANQSSHYLERNFTSLEDGIHSFTAYAQDIAGNVNNTAQRTAIIDTVNLDAVRFLSPTPSNDTNLSQNNYFVNVSFNDTNPDWCSLEVKNATGILNHTMSQGANQSEYYMNLTGQADFYTEYQAYCNDTAGNLGISEKRQTTIDTVAPNAVGFLAPTPVNDSSLSEDNYFINASFNDTNPGRCILELTNSTGTINYTMSQGANVTEWNFNVTGQSDYGTYFYAYCNDTAGNLMISMARHVTLDTTGPTNTGFMGLTPANDTNLSQDNYFVNVSFDDATTGAGTCMLELTNGTGTVNYTMSNYNSTSCIYNVTGQSDYSEYFYVYVADAVGNMARSSARHVTIDQGPPSFSGYAINATPNEDQDVELNVTVTYVGAATDWVMIEIKNNTDTVNYTAGTKVGSEYHFILDQGNYMAHDNITWFWYANDTAGNLGRSSQQEFTVANQAPTHSNPVLNATTDSNRTNDNLRCYNVSTGDQDDEDTVLNTIRWYNNSERQDFLENATIVAFGNTSRDEGWICEVIPHDGYVSGTAKNSTTLTILNTQPQTPKLTDPANNSYIPTTNVTFRYSTTDNDSDSLNYHIYINGSLNASTGQSSKEINFSNGYYCWNVTAGDGTDNSSGSTTWCFTIDMVPPALEFVPPTPENSSARRLEFEVNVSITEEYPDDLKYSWNGTNYTIYNDSLVLMLNFDNVSALGEDYSTGESTVLDFSRYGNNGVAKNNLTWNSTGKFGGAFEFDGLDDYINVSGLSSLGLALEVWKKNATDPDWYHLVNSSGTLYVNGEAGSGHVMPVTNTTGEVIVGRDSDGSHFDGSIDEVRIWNRSLSAEEVNYSYHSNLKKYEADQWILWVRQTGLTRGESYTYYIYGSDRAGNANQTGLRTVAGNTEPGFVSIARSPNTEDDMDPNVTITITANVSDTDRNLDAAILQWKNSSQNWSEAQNLTMNNLSAKGLYTTVNGSFAPAHEANYSYRLWANDTEGGSNTSSQTNISVFYDWTWSISATFTEASGIYNTVNSIGNFTVNNTGDYGLSFLLSDDSPYGDFGLTFDTLGSPSFTLSSNQSNKESRTFGVNATFGSASREDNVTITVKASPSASADPPSRTYSFIMVSYSGGGYFYLTIPTYPLTVSHGDTGKKLTARLRNLGNATTENCSINWSLPSGWDISSGNQSDYIGNITAGSINWSSILVSIDRTSALPGTQTITAEASSDSNTSDSHPVSIVVSCTSGDDYCGYDCNASTDADCAAAQVVTQTVSRGGGGGFSGPVVVEGGGLTLEQRSRLFRTEEKFELVRGEDDKFTVTVTNPLTERMENVTISIEGYLSGKLRLDRVNLGSLEPDEATNVTVYIEAPKYLSRGVNVLTLTIRGQSRYEKTILNITEQRTVNLVIHEIPRRIAEDSLNDTTEILDRMKGMGLAAGNVEEILLQSRAYLEEGNYVGVQQNRERAEGIFSAALGALDSIQKAAKSIEEAEYEGIATPSTKRLFTLAKVAFDRGDFALAKSRVDEALLTFAAETKGEFNVAVFIIRNWWQIGIAMVILAIGSFFGYIVTRLFLINRKLGLIGEEEKILVGLIKEVQHECLELGRMSMSEYREAVRQYEKRLARALTRRVELGSLRLHLLSFQKHSALAHEREALINILKETQDLYLVKGRIETHVYENKIRSIKERLAVVEEELTTLEAEKEIKGRASLRGRILNRLRSLPP